MRTLRFGGKLLPGDFIAVSNGNWLTFGWYAGDGRGTLQYYTMHGPGVVYKNYQQFLQDPNGKDNKYLVRQYEKGFTIKTLWKSYINAVHSTRVVKIENPESILTEEDDIEAYQKSKEVLITLNFIKK